MKKPPSHVSSAIGPMVHHLRDSGFPISAIAEAAKVDRAELYALVDGAVEDGAAERLRTLFRLLADARHDLAALYRVWQRPLSTGVTMRDLFAAPHLDEAAAVAGLRELGPAISRHADRDSSRRPATEGTRHPIIDEMPEAGFQR